MAVAVGTFVALGMPVAAFSVAWPYAARELDRSIGDLGVVLVLNSVGFGLVAAFTGRLVTRFGIAWLVAVAAVVNALALVAGAASPDFVLLLVAIGVVGASDAVLDAGLNTYVALEMDARALNFIHAGFGLGAAVGPWLMTAAVVTVGWRAGMVATAVIVALPAAAFWLTRHDWSIVTTGDSPAERRRPAPAVVALMLAVFLVYSGVEVGAGTWAFSLLTEGRGVSAGLAGGAVGGFWAALTGSRVVMGIAAGRWRARSVIVGCGAAALTGLALLWWSPSPGAGIAGLLVAGFALGPLFPLHTSLTAARVGREASRSLIGVQLAASVSGGALIPWLIGVAVNARGLHLVAPVLVVSAGAMIAIDVALERAVRRVAPPTT